MIQPLRCVLAQRLTALQAMFCLSLDLRSALKALRAMFYLSLELSSALKALQPVREQFLLAL